MTKKNDLLIEIGTEELPPKSLKTLAEAFAHNLQQQLNNAELSFERINFFATPRRLALHIEQLSAQQADRMAEKRGPALNAAFDAEQQPTKALIGFASSCKTTLDKLEKLVTPQGSWMVYRFHQAGKSIQELLPTLVTQALSALPIPKPMRWHSYDTQFVRPIHWVVMLYGKEMIAGEVLGIAITRETFGHRFHHPAAIKLSDANAYVQALKKTGNVIVDFAERKQIIRDQIAAIAKQQNCQVIVPDALLDEVTSLVEWPVALLANFDPTFLTVPREALIAAMQEHQRCFALEDQQQQLLPHFITVSNIASKDPAEVIRGNERVMRARLADAKFFYDTDCKQTLASRLDGLKQVVFQAKLGSLYDKSTRIAELAKWIATQLNSKDATAAERAGLLCKTDLMTQMVGEFPELQGIMGYHYAKNDAESDTAAIAIRDHYLPRFAGDALPASPTSCAVALADRIDTLVGVFGINQAPTGDKDPFALRRAALGVIRILIENNFDINLHTLITSAINNYTATLPNPETNASVLQFILDRLPAWYAEQTIAADTLQAVLAAQQSNDNLHDIHKRVLAVQAFRQLPPAESLAAANKRVKNLLSKSAQTINEQIILPIDNALLVTIEEKNLYTALEAIHTKIAHYSKDKNYTTLLTELANLQAPVDCFFDKVLVMEEDEKLRNNRLALLAKLRALFLTVADISLLQG